MSRNRRSAELPEAAVITSETAGDIPLRSAQLEWIKYRDLDFKLIDSIYDGMQGTMYIPMRVEARLEVIKKRALELKGYLDLITEGE